MNDTINSHLLNSVVHNCSEDSRRIECAVDVMFERMDSVHPIESISSELSGLLRSNLTGVAKNE